MDSTGTSSTATPGASSTSPLSLILQKMHGYLLAWVTWIHSLWLSLLATRLGQEWRDRIGDSDTLLWFHSLDALPFALTCFVLILLLVLVLRKAWHFCTRKRDPNTRNRRVEISGSSTKTPASSSSSYSSSAFLFPLAKRGKKGRWSLFWSKRGLGFRWLAPLPPPVSLTSSFGTASAISKPTTPPSNANPAPSKPVFDMEVNGIMLSFWPLREKLANFRVNHVRLSPFVARPLPIPQQASPPLSAPTSNVAHNVSSPEPPVRTTFSKQRPLSTPDAKGTTTISSQLPSLLPQHPSHPPVTTNSGKLLPQISRVPPLPRNRNRQISASQLNPSPPLSPPFDRGMAEKLLTRVLESLGGWWKGVLLRACSITLGEVLVEGSAGDFGLFKQHPFVKEFEGIPLAVQVSGITIFVNGRPPSSGQTFQPLEFICVVESITGEWDNKQICHLSGLSFTITNIHPRLRKVVGPQGLVAGETSFIGDVRPSTTLALNHIAVTLPSLEILARMAAKSNSKVADPTPLNAKQHHARTTSHGRNPGLSIAESVEELQLLSKASTQFESIIRAADGALLLLDTGKLSVQSVEIQVQSGVKTPASPKGGNVPFGTGAKVLDLRCSVSIQKPAKVEPTTIRAELKVGLVSVSYYPISTLARHPVPSPKKSPELASAMSVNATGKKKIPGFSFSTAINVTCTVPVSAEHLSNLHQLGSIDNFGSGSIATSPTLELKLNIGLESPKLRLLQPNPASPIVAGKGKASLESLRAAVLKVINREASAEFGFTDPSDKIKHALSSSNFALNSNKEFTSVFTLAKLALKMYTPTLTLTATSPTVSFQVRAYDSIMHAEPTDALICGNCQSVRIQCGASFIASMNSAAPSAPSLHASSMSLGPHVDQITVTSRWEVVKSAIYCSLQDTVPSVTSASNANWNSPGRGMSQDTVYTSNIKSNAIPSTRGAASLHEEGHHLSVIHDPWTQVDRVEMEVQGDVDSLQGLGVTCRLNSSAVIITGVCLVDGDVDYMALWRALGIPIASASRAAFTSNSQLDGEASKAALVEPDPSPSIPVGPLRLNRAEVRYTTDLVAVIFVGQMKETSMISITGCHVHGCLNKPAALSGLTSAGVTTGTHSSIIGGWNTGCDLQAIAFKTLPSLNYYAFEELDRLSTPMFTVPGVVANMTINTKYLTLESNLVSMDLDLPRIFVAVKSVTPLFQLIQTAIREARSANTPHGSTLNVLGSGSIASVDIDTTAPPKIYRIPINCKVLVGKLAFNCILPEQTRVRGHIVDFDFNVDKCNVHSTFKEFVFEILIPSSFSTKGEENWATMAKGDTFTMLHSPDNVGKSNAPGVSAKKSSSGINLVNSEFIPPLIIVRVNAFAIRIHYGYPPSFVVEGMTDFYKLVTAILMDVGMIPSQSSNPTLSPGFADVHLSIAKLHASFEDDPFECALARNYRAGRTEQEIRLERSKEFKKMATAKGRERTGGTSTSLLTNPDIQDAYWLLQEMNSNAWIARCKANQAKAEFNESSDYTDYPSEKTIFAVNAKNLFLKATAPTLPVPWSVHESLHKIDPDTCVGTQYASIIARNISLDFDGISVQLRDYPYPLLHVPTSGKVWNTSGLLVVADLEYTQECSRKVQVSLAPLPLPPLITTRSLNPIKVYMESVSIFQSNTTIRASYGSCLEPVLADFVRIIDTFTKPNIDPSTPIGWWDKVRLIMHGTHSISIKGGGDVRVLVFGTNTPYYDPRYDYGTLGVEICFSRGVQIELGQSVKISSGLCGLSIPKAQYDIKRDLGHLRQDEEENIVARLAGGVACEVSLSFTIKGFDGEETAPTRNHSDILLYHPEYCFGDKSKWDSFAGYRTHRIHVKVDISTPKPLYHGLSIPSNFIHMDMDVLARLGVLYGIYQSVLTSIPIRTGILFGVMNAVRVKLSDTIGSVRINLHACPLIFGVVCELESGHGGVGFRCRTGEMRLDMLWVQRFLNRERLLLKQKISGAKWSLEESGIEFFEFEARTLTFSKSTPSKGSATSAAKKEVKEEEQRQTWADESTDIYWLIASDTALFEMFPERSMIPFAWTPKITYFRRSNNPTYHQINHRRDIDTFQLKLYATRLEELEYELDNAISPDVREELMNKKALVEDYIQHFIASANELSSPQQESVRNSLFKFFDLQAKGNSIGYCVSQSAVRVIAQLLDESESRKQASHLDRSFVAGDKDHNTDEDRQHRASEILAKLVADLQSGVKTHVLNENFDDTESVANPFEVEDARNRDPLKNMIEEHAYIPSRDILSPDYISHEHIFESAYVLDLIKPQIHFETPSEGLSSSVLLAGQRLLVRGLNIIDAHILSPAQIADQMDKSEAIVKFRQVWNFDRVSFYIADQDEVGDPNAPNWKDIWPVWIPIECFIGNSLPFPYLKKVVEKTSVTFHRDRQNELYQNVSGAQGSFHILLPVFELSVNALEYKIIFDVISNLLIYSDPARGRRNEELKKTMLALEQREDLSDILQTVESIQSKIRGSQASLRKCSSAEMYEMLRKKILHAQEELWLVFTSFKQISSLASKRKSVNVDWGLTVVAANLIWNMHLDIGTRFMRVHFENGNYTLIQNEDQSSTNTLQIDALHVENAMPNPTFPDVISPYLPGRSKVDFSRQKMVRVFFSEISPVGGIQVVDHFEINIYPLLIQMTYETGKMLINYIFPEKKKAVKAEEASLPSLSSSQDVLDKNVLHDLKVMQARALTNKSFIYVKIPGVNHCLSYKGMKSKNFEDLYLFEFSLPTLEYRNKTWTWFDFLEAIKKDALRAVFANTGALVKKKLFSRKGGGANTNSNQSSGESTRPTSPELQIFNSRMLLGSLSQAGSRDFSENPASTSK